MDRIRIDREHRRHNRPHHAPQNTGSNLPLFAGLFLCAGVAIMVGAAIFMFARNNPVAATPVKAAPTATLPVKGDNPLPQTPDYPPNNANKGSGNNGTKNNVLVVEGNNNNVHIGDNVTNNVNVTIVVQDNSAKASPKATTPPPPVPAPVATTTRPTGRERDPSCEVQLQKHNAQVAAWRAEFNK